MGKINLESGLIHLGNWTNSNWKLDKNGQNSRGKWVKSTWESDKINLEKQLNQHGKWVKSTLNQEKIICNGPNQLGKEAKSKRELGKSTKETKEMGQINFDIGPNQLDKWASSSWKIG